MITIKYANQGDIITIKTLAERIWPVAFSTFLSEQQIRYMLNWMYSDESLSKQMIEGCVFIIANENNLPVGFASWQQISRSEAKLHKLYVLPEMQGKKVGYTLLQEVIAQCYNQKVKKLFLNVNRYNHPAINFYMRNGFSIEREEDINIGEGYYMNDYVMIKEIISRNKENKINLSS